MTCKSYQETSFENKASTLFAWRQLLVSCSYNIQSQVSILCRFDFFFSLKRDGYCSYRSASEVRHLAQIFYITLNISVESFPRFGAETCIPPEDLVSETVKR